MIRRRKADTGDGTSTTHRGHDDQSETDSQNQSSEETNGALQVLSNKGKTKVLAQVCSDKECQRSSPSELLLQQLQNQRRFYSKARFLFPLGIIRDYHHITFLSDSPDRCFSGHRFGAYIRRALKFTRHTWSFCRLFRRLRYLLVASTDRPLDCSGRVEEAAEHHSRTLEVKYRWPRIPSRRCDEGEGFGSEIPRCFDSWSDLNGTFVS
jgi:hypothetical protein